MLRRASEPPDTIPRPARVKNPKLLSTWPIRVTFDTYT